ncbi:hypothetical protein PN398_09065 [Romboutsia sp. 1001216sp1]|uniref:hypothetical protein n=1 Tax=Romboutsia sp. 1001216sp1 TaxID=2986997 RepID=UPI00232D8925|nr:hypothetical protein [Romboutsia sp. 1001216sp1]MDB8790874.1 hypothetical protein [Romboutsia sp. 1001216sp1]
MNNTNDNDVLYELNCPLCGKYICFNGADNYDNRMWNDEVIGEIKIHKRSQTYNNRGYHEDTTFEMKCPYCGNGFSDEIHFSFNV